MNKIRVKGFGGVYFWMERVSEEKSELARELIKQAQLLHFQTVQWENMSKEVQEEVLTDLCAEMVKMGWEDSVKEYFGDKN